MIDAAHNYSSIRKLAIRLGLGLSAAVPRHAQHGLLLTAAPDTVRADIANKGAAAAGTCVVLFYGVHTHNSQHEFTRIT